MCPTAADACRPAVHRHAQLASLRAAGLLLAETSEDSHASGRALKDSAPFQNKSHDMTHDGHREQGLQDVRSVQIKENLRVEELKNCVHYSG